MNTKTQQTLLESKVLHCKDCSELKTAFLDGKFDGINKRWTDENGKLWNGKRCPDCHRKLIKANMQKMRSNKCLKD